jgi:uncharacterized membrane protein
MDVTVRSPLRLTPDMAELERLHLLVLDDVGRAGISDEALAALARWVVGGGALIATGGEHLFGDPGFVGTPFERVLPVALQAQGPEPKERDPIALYLVIDRSNSMGYASSEAMRYGEKMEYAKRAAVAVIDQLGPRDLVSAVAFDSQAHDLGPLGSLAESGNALRGKIRQLQYGGGTDFKDALELARRRLAAAEPRVRHVILLTDGDTNRRAEDHAEVIAALVEAGITVTAIRIGTDTANLELLDQISRATGGAFHHAEDVQVLPQLMISDAQLRMDAAGNRRHGVARIADAGAVLAGIGDQDLPPVSRWAITRPKKGAEVRMVIEAGERREPLLVTWQYGLGRTAVLPLDFQAGAAAWPGWRGFARLWSQLARWAAPRALPFERHLSARRLREGTLVQLETVAEAAGPFVLRLPAVGDLVLRPAGRRTFAAMAGPLEPGAHAARLVIGSGGEAFEEEVQLVVPAWPVSGQEHRATAPNWPLLERVATLTGGGIGPTPAALLAARQGVARDVLPLEGILIPLALLLFLADVALRRAAL